MLTLSIVFSALFVVYEKCKHELGFENYQCLRIKAKQVEEERRRGTGEEQIVNPLRTASGCVSGRAEQKSVTRLASDNRSLSSYYHYHPLTMIHTPNVPTPKALSGASTPATGVFDRPGLATRSSSTSSIFFGDSDVEPIVMEGLPHSEVKLEAR